ncbi:small conductance mechanosensitive channel [Devosia enhydra]|uniref:Small conductance mechanosensitive channel n=1 Tax=Devosia enhydra TaxID=665118 RepID=A0A1K2HXB2_9HYPH|nr:mechanosensitive ion channel domain-containing protein [Devosia enhydra]SFZ84278.1 small conductance mechanosensitive channel [Devosia enhydra]
MPPLVRNLIVALFASLFMAIPVSAQEASTTETAPAEAAPLETLVEVLKDDAARQTLIEELEAQIGNTAGPVEAAPPPAPSLGGRLADMTKQTAEVAADSAARFWRQLTGLPGTLGAIGSGDFDALGRQLLDLVLLALITYATFLVLRLVGERLRRLLLAKARFGTAVVRVLAALFITLGNLVLVALAWAIGHIVALTFFGTPGFIAFHHSAFLNAFLLVEGSQALIRALLSPRRAELRGLPLSDADAYELTRRARVLVSVLVFGQLLLVPIANRSLSADAGTMVSVAVLTVMLALLVNLVLNYRERVTARLVAFTHARAGSGMSFLAQFWHLPVLAYLIGLFVVVVVQPTTEVLPILGNTAKLVAAIVAGFMVSHLLGRLIMGGVRVPPRVAERVPLLETRLNAFVPKALGALRLLVFIMVFAFVLDQLGLFDLGGWLESELGARVATSTLTVAAILLAAFVAWLTLNSWVDYRFHPDSGPPLKARERTLLVLMRNAATIAIVVMAAMFTLSEVGINIAPLLASAGVIGLAVGFGAQKLVQDIITGIFIQLEGAMDVGDVVTIAGVTGSVERLTIRSAALRDGNGAYHVIPFSAVTTVSNLLRGYSVAMCDIAVAHAADLAAVKAAMADAFAWVKASPAGEGVIGEFDWVGVEAITETGVTVRAQIKALPGKQWPAKRAFLAKVMSVFEERGIPLAGPQRIAVFAPADPPAAALRHQPVPE